MIINTKLTVLTVVVISLFGLIGCNDPEKVSGKEFKRQYELNYIQTLQLSEYIGQHEGKAYMKIKTMSSVGSGYSKERIIFTEIDNLDSEFKNKLMKENKNLGLKEIQR
ncbi:MAG: hypothetical protein FD156_816 [Nitrospirae bacterium]|nr:MAG: hypothetical protein FD156_816 [Nitrospirota bacterium]